MSIDRKYQRKINNILVNHMTLFPFKQIIRANSLIKNHGFKTFLKELFKKIIYLMSAWGENDKKFQQIITSTLENNPNKAILVYPPILDYKIQLFQRPQHLANEMSKLGYLFLYLTPNYSDGVKQIKMINENLLLINCREKLKTEQVLNLVSAKKNEIYMFLSSTDNHRGLQFVKDCLSKGYYIIYDYIDKIDEKISETEIPQSTWDKHNYILENEEITVIATSQKLYNEVETKRKNNFYLISNGVNYHHFSRFVSANFQRDNSISVIKRKYNEWAVIGYFGAFSSWFDYELINKLATCRPSYEIILIGVDHDGSLKTSSISNLKNVHYLGPIDYEELPRFASHFSVSIIPFLVNDITIAVSPIKLFEYMALRKPIVTTALPECEKSKSAIVAYNHDDFIKKVDEAICTAGDLNYLNGMEMEAKQNSWENKAKEIKLILESSKDAKNYYSNKNDVLFFSIINWEFRHQRPQQLCEKFADDERRVFFFNTEFSKERTKINRIFDNLYSISLKASKEESIHTAKIENQPEFNDEIDSIIKKYNIKGCDVIVEYPNWYPLAKYLKDTFNFKIIYDYLDELEGFHTANEYMINMSNKLMKECDLIIASSDYLANRAKEIYNKKIKTVRNGCDFPHFFLKEKAKISERPIVGYYGAIADWFDVKKIIFMAEKYPIWEIRLIGSFQFCPLASKLKKYDNVKLYGEVAYKLLPTHVKYFDICIIPFRADLDLIKATNPVKFYEYLASGKKIVATEIEDLKPYANKFLYMENDDETFCQLVEDCINDTDKLASYDQRIDFAQQNDWAIRAKSFLMAVDQVYKKVSIIILTYNNLEMTKDCIESILLKTQYPKYEIIIVDNNSTDGTQKYLQELKLNNKYIKIILNNFNAGFAKGNNLGMQIAEGDYIVLLNNDTVVSKGWLTSLIKHLDKDSNIGMVGPVTNEIGNEARIDVPFSEIRNKNMDIFAATYTQEHLNELIEIKTLAMFCLAFRKSLLDQIGLLDERFEIGMFEDDDYSLRVKKEGFKLKFAEDTFIFHKGRAAFKLLGDEKYMEIFNKNKNLYESKHGVSFEQHRYRK